MKKIIIAAAFLGCLCACNSNISDNDSNSSQLPSTMEELVEHITDMTSDGCRQTITSQDSVKTIYRYDFWHIFEDMPEEADNAEPVVLPKVVNDSVAEVLNAIDEDKRIQDSVMNQQIVLRDYLTRAVNHLNEKYRPTAKKYYRYETHAEGKDTIEISFATKELTDSLPDERKGYDFSRNFYYYPEFFHFASYKGTSKYREKEEFVNVVYRKEERVAQKKKTTEKEVKAFILDFISNYKNTESIPVKYEIDEGKTYDDGCVSYASGCKSGKKALIDGTLYTINVKGKEKVKAIEDLRNALVDFATSHYSDECLEVRFSTKPNHLEYCNSMHSQMMELSFKEAKGGTLVSGTFHIQIGNYDDDSGIKILLLKAHDDTLFIPWNWMKIKHVHNNEIELINEK